MLHTRIYFETNLSSWLVERSKERKERVRFERSKVALTYFQQQGKHKKRFTSTHGTSDEGQQSCTCGAQCAGRRQPGCVVRCRLTVCTYALHANTNRYTIYPGRGAPPHRVYVRRHSGARVHAQAPLRVCDEQPEPVDTLLCHQTASAQSFSHTVRHEHNTYIHRLTDHIYATTISIVYIK